jgi:hypothetical protein
MDRSHPRWTAQAVARRVIGREAKALRQMVKDFVRGPHLPLFGLGDSFIKLRTLLRRHPVIEGAHDGSLIELLGDLPLLRLVESLEQFDDLGLSLGHDEYIRPVLAAVERMARSRCPDDRSSLSRNPENGRAAPAMLPSGSAIPGFSLSLHSGYGARLTPSAHPAYRSVPPSSDMPPPDFWRMSRYRTRSWSPCCEPAVA